jgi:hypothetical protein
MMMRMMLLKTNLADISNELQVTVHNLSKLPKNHVLRNSLCQDNAIHVVVQWSSMNTALLMYVLYPLKVRFNSYFITQDFSEQVPSSSEIEYTDNNGQDSLSLLDDKFKFALSIVLVLLYLFPCRHLLTFFSKSLSI